MELGATNIIVRSIEPQSTGDGRQPRQDVWAAASRLSPNRLEHSPITRAFRCGKLKREFWRRTALPTCKLVGCIEDYLELNRLEMARGRWLQRARRRQEGHCLGRRYGANDCFPTRTRLARRVGWEANSNGDRPDQTAHRFGRDRRQPRCPRLQPGRVHSAGHFRHRVGDLVMKRVGEVSISRARTSN